MADPSDGQEEIQEPNYKEILAELDAPFLDEAFAPDLRSIITSESVFELSSEEEEILQGLEYARLSKIYNTKTTKFFGDISPDVIQQGCLCNSYFLSAISALAENPKRIKK
jgi:hypothetical protein